MSTILILILLIVAGAMAYVRLAPLQADRLTARQGPAEAGTHVAEGGYKVVMPVADGAAALDALRQVALETPRTEALTGAEAETQAFVTRSRVWGFPDITTAWVEQDALHIRAHLVYGRRDFGVNRARVEDWLARAGLR
jgi:hypothetical protein